MAYVADPNDPFAQGEKSPSLSWDVLPIGSMFTLTIRSEAKLLQASQFGTKSLKFWDDEKTRPVMCAVLNVLVTAGPHSEGEERSIWAQIPSNLFIALKEAQKTAGAKFLPGGTLQLKLIGETPHEKKGYNPIKQYAARYTPPTAASQDDPFDGPAPQATRMAPAATTKSAAATQPGGKPQW